MKLIVITRPDLFDGESAWIEALFDAGLEILHLRKPSATEQQVESIIKEIPLRYHSRIVLHQCFNLASKYALRGIHLNARNHTIPIGYKGQISRSCHTLKEVDEHKNSCDYLFLSPIFDSISKQGYYSSFTADTLKAARAEDIIDQRVIALGGICKQNIPSVINWGFGGVALLGEIWNNVTIEESTTRLKQIKNMIIKQIPPKILSIAGSDPSGGAGIQADIKAITALGGYAATAITALTIQNTQGVESIFAVPAQTVADQIRVIMEDINPQAVKIGMVNDKAIVHAIADALLKYNPQHVVYDPVMVSTSGHRLIEYDTIEYIERELIPLTSLLTPNMHEAAVLWRKEIDSVDDMKCAATELHKRYGIAVLIKGGHLGGADMCDILCDTEGQLHTFTERKIETHNLHGTGCTLSSSIATMMARGMEYHEAIVTAKRYVTAAIERGATMIIGHGNGPLWHMVSK